MARISGSKFRTGVGGGSGTLDTVATGTTTAVASLSMKQVRPGSLSATYVVEAATASITIAAKWQGSADGSTWVDIAYAPQNPAAVVLATGTAAELTKVVPAPACVHGFQFVRATVVSGGVEGEAVDTYAITYNYLAA